MSTAATPRTAKPFSLRTGNWPAPPGPWLLPLLLLPMAILLWDAWTGALQPRPITAAVLETGSWALRFTFLTLAITPIRRVLDWPRLLRVRRTIGLVAAFYATIHLTLFIADMSWDLSRALQEMILRLYLFFGLGAWILMWPLAVTSTDAMIRRLRAERWQVLHRLVYGALILGMLHSLFRAKAGVVEPLLMTGLLILLLLLRLAHSYWRPRSGLSPTDFLIVLLGATVLTALAEIGWAAATSGVPPLRLLQANWHPAVGWRPAQIVLAIGLPFWALGWWRRSGKAAVPRGRRTQKAVERSAAAIAPGT